MPEGKIILTVNSAGLRTGLNAARQMTRSFASNVSGELLGAFSFAAVVAGLKSVSDEIGRIADLSRRGYSTDFLQDLQATAKLSGQDIDGVTRAFSKLASEINSASGPTEQMRSALDEIGLSVDALAGLNPEHLFREVGAAIGGIKDESEQAAAVTDILGARFQDLIPLLQDYAANGLENTNKATSQQVDEIDRMNDAMDRLTTTLRSAAVPVLSLLAKALAGVQLAAKNAGAAFGGAFLALENLMSGKGPIESLKDAFDATFKTVRENYEEFFNSVNPPAPPPPAPGEGMPGRDGGAKPAGSSFPKSDMDEYEREMKRQEALRIQAEDTREQAADIRQEMALKEQALFDPRALRVSAIQSVGGGGGTALPDFERILRKNEEQRALLARIDERLAAIQQDGAI
jgi:hypothetical protein